MNKSFLLSILLLCLVACAPEKAAEVEVLILIVMEDALRAMPNTSLGKNAGCLIAVKLPLDRDENEEQFINQLFNS